jgi:hypothetical protein
MTLKEVVQPMDLNSVFNEAQRLANDQFEL